VYLDTYKNLWWFGGEGPPPLGSSWGSPRNTPMSPTKVGGVYLGGASQALDGIGMIEGIDLDSNNNLILLSKDGEVISLPPLRLDDVVTVFRSVYIHGEGPSVTIDPNPENPEGSAMIIRHGKATENTYVGWVLYQADRLMKGYTLGVDNITRQEVGSSVSGYSDVLNTIYFGGKSPEKLRKKGHWERFWIVPSETRRFGVNRKSLTLLDVPLKVKTQKMKWKDRVLVDDLKGKSSLGAVAFTDWFTHKYDQIAEEQFLTPPSGSGITFPVPVFMELRRIALITAIAEKLRDQGDPMPFWMRDYEIKPVSFEKFTPALEVTRSKQENVARVYGGVQLSPEDKNVSNFTTNSDLSMLTKQDRKFVRKKITLANSLEQTIQNSPVLADPLEIRKFSLQGENYQVVALPGAETKALAPGRMEEVDLSVSMGGGIIQLQRNYNSFFNPSGPWGSGWTLNLPRLKEIKMPIRRIGGKTPYQVGYELITPLNSMYARFSRVEEVPMLNNSRLQVPDQSTVFYGLANDKPSFLSGPTLKLIRKDGDTWHFSDDGSLVAIESVGFRTVYERDNKGRLMRIVGLRGQQKVAFINLIYNASGRLESAKAYSANRDITESIVRYEYDNVDRLISVASEEGRLGYQYKGAWVNAVTYQVSDNNGKPGRKVTLHRYEYTPRGQLLNEIDVNGGKITYHVTSDFKGSTVTAKKIGKNSEEVSFRYDRSYRPIEAKFDDGAMATWDYPADGGAVLNITGSDGDLIRLSESSDRRQRLLEFNKKLKISSEYDVAGHLTSLVTNGREYLQQEWSLSGQLRRAKIETSSSHFEYDSDGLISRILLAPPGESGKFKHWHATKMDSAGRPVEFTDYRGLNVSLGYTNDGDLTEMVNHRDGKHYGLSISRNESGRIQEVNSSWEKQQYSYNDTGYLSKVKVMKNGGDAYVEWKAGLIQTVKQFDGGSTSFIYHDEEKRTGLIQQINTPNQLALNYHYDSSNRLSKVDVGDLYRLELNYDNKGRLIGWHNSAFTQ